MTTPRRLPRPRAALLALGACVLAALWLGPLPALARGAFWAHMTLHVGVVAVAAPLLALGLAGGRLDPVRVAPGWFPPIPLSLLELIVVWVWHMPALHLAARRDATDFAAEQTSFLVAGLLVWLSAFGGRDADGAADPEAAAYLKNRYASGLVALLLTSMHMTLLGALIALSPRALFASVEWCGTAGRVATPLDDQHLGGALMLLVGGASYLAGGLWLTGALLEENRSEEAAT